MEWRLRNRPRLRRFFRWFLLAVLALMGLAALTLWCLDLAFAAPGWQGPVSDHFDGTYFRNAETPPPPTESKSRTAWMLGRLFHPAWQDIAVTPTVPATALPTGHLRLTWVGHSTVLLQAGDINILTDPVWAERVGPVSWAGPRRRAAPGIRFEDLPPIHLVLLSHNHYDHCDLDTLGRLAHQHHAPIITGLGVDRLLARRDITTATAIDWWQSCTPVPGVRVTGVPAQHFSGRFLSDRNRTLWLGFVVETSSGSIYFAGDTGTGGHFAAIGARFPGLRLALIPIGAYQPRWMMSPVHLNPAEAVAAAHAVGAATSFAIHWNTFALADDAPDDPPRDLAAALAADPSPPRFWTLQPGACRDVP